MLLVPCFLATLRLWIIHIDNEELWFVVEKWKAMLVSDIADSMS